MVSVLPPVVNTSWTRSAITSASATLRTPSGLKVVAVAPFIRPYSKQVLTDGAAQYDSGTSVKPPVYSAVF